MSVLPLSDYTGKNTGKEKQFDKEKLYKVSTILYNATKDFSLTSGLILQKGYSQDNGFELYKEWTSYFVDGEFVLDRITYKEDKDPYWKIKDNDKKTLISSEDADELLVDLVTKYFDFMDIMFKK